MSAIRLLYINSRVTQTLKDGTFERDFGVHLNQYADIVNEMVRAGEDLRTRTNAPEQWGGYLAVNESESSSVVGCCGFRGAPGFDERVEIAYFTFPVFEGRGIASAMARALVEIAQERGVQPIAHTLAVRGASTRILERLGFTHMGTVIADPEDGPVWRWELSHA